MLKKFILFFIIIFLLLQFNSEIYCERVMRKDPLLAGVLSWYMPGLGQFYAEEYLKGSIFWLVENGLLVSAILVVADIHFSMNKDIGFQFTIKLKDEITPKQERIGLSLGIAYLLFHIYNVVDAIQTAKIYNLEHKLHSRLTLDYKNIADNNFYSLNYKF